MEQRDCGCAFSAKHPKLRWSSVEHMELHCGVGLLHAPLPFFHFACMSKRGRFEENELPEGAVATTSTDSSKRTKTKRRASGSTPLQRFRKQQQIERKRLQQERKRIDRELRAIEKDIGVFKRVRKPT